MKNRIILNLLTIVLGVGLSAGSSGIRAADRPYSGEEPGKTPLTPEQALKIRTIGDLRFSPDGERIAMTVTEPVKGVSRNSDIWIYETGAGILRCFASSEKPDFSPRWARDGKSLAFLSGRGEKTQIYRIRVDGGEAEALTDSPTGVRSFAWSPSGNRMLYMAPEPESEEKKRKREEKDDARVVDKETAPARLWLFENDTRKARPLTRGEWRISSYCWGPGGEFALVSATDQNHPEIWLDRLYRLDLAGGEPQEIARPDRPFGAFKLSPDGRHLAFTGPRRDGPSPFDIHVIPVGGGEARNLTRTSIDRVVSAFEWIDAGRLVCQVPLGFETGFFEVDLTGGATRREAFDVDPGGSFAVCGGRTAFVGQSAVSPPELWISTAAGRAEKVSDFNAEWKGVRLIEPEIFTYPSFDGREIEAALFKPPGFTAGGRIPLVVLVHGGPSGRWGLRIHAWSQLLSQRGYAVLCPNIRGSIGYGFEFMSSNRRDWGGGDYRDVLAGVGALIESGIADPDRLGIGGWSYGGYMAAWAVTQTDRFTASVSGAPMTDLAVEYGTESPEINAYDTWYMGTPYENLDLFVERSPLTHVRHVRTPTLILCGEEDRTDPVGQCHQFHRGLKRYGVPVELVIFPREGHGIREERHQIDLLRRVISWFEKYL